MKDFTDLNAQYCQPLAACGQYPKSEPGQWHYLHDSYQGGEGTTGDLVFIGPIGTPLDAAWERHERMHAP